MKKLSIFLLLLFCITATQTFARDFTVNLPSDERDANIIDRNCDVDLATEGEQCTLRAAIEQANSLASNHRVLFDLPANSTITLTLSGGREILIKNRSRGLEIIGTGANNLTIDGGAGQNRIFYSTLSRVTISGVTLTGGGGAGVFPEGGGGAIFVYGGSLNLDRVHVTGNTLSTDLNGGGVVFSGGVHRITDSTFSANRTNGPGGGFCNLYALLTVTGSTISGNKAGSGGGFADIEGTTTLRNATITNNTAIWGGGIFQTVVSSAQGTLNFGNTVVAGNFAASSTLSADIAFLGGTIISMGNNLVNDSANTGNTIAYQATDIRDVNPMLDALADNGGPTPTHAPLMGSPLIDRGDNSLAVDPVTNLLMPTDQRGLPRFLDGDGDGVATVDIGAVEFLRSVRRSGRARWQLMF